MPSVHLKKLTYLPYFEINKVSFWISETAVFLKHTSILGDFSDKRLENHLADQELSASGNAGFSEE